MSTASGKNSDCFTVGYGVFHPFTLPQRMRFSFSVGAASGSLKFMRALASAAARSAAAEGPFIALGFLLVSNSDCLGTSAV